MSCILHDWIALQNQTDLIYDFVYPLFKFWLCNLFEIESEYMVKLPKFILIPTIILIVRIDHPHGVQGW